MRFLVAIALVFALTTVASAKSFTKATNYMSRRGYDRWQNYQQTGKWLPR